MPPEVSFYGQPFANEETAGAFLREALVDPTIDRVTVLAAWSRFGGLRRVKADLEAFRERDGHAVLVTGIDEGVATRPGLALALGLFDEVYVLHDRSGRTFHPKLYLAEGAIAARALVGSSNLTAGGLYWNYEAGLRADFVLPDEDADPALAGIRGYIETLRGDDQLCLKLSEEMLEQLVTDPRYSVSGQERRSRRKPDDLPPGVGPGDVDQDAEAGGEGGHLFGPSRHTRTHVPPLPAGAAQELKDLEIGNGEPGSDESGDGEGGNEGGTETETGGDVGGGLGGQPAAPPPSSVVEQWDKVLRATDAQQPLSPGTNPTANVRLTKSSHDIDWLTYFRQVLFGSESWVQQHDSQGNPTETAAVPMRVTIDGTDHGTVAMRVDHAPHRESGQANHATVLHWGELLSVMTENDFTGYTLTLARMADGSYALGIGP